MSLFNTEVGGGDSWVRFVLMFRFRTCIETTESNFPVSKRTETNLKNCKLYNYKYAGL